jgi:hypothetical protein
MLEAKGDKLVKHLSTAIKLQGVVVDKNVEVSRGDQLKMMHRGEGHGAIMSSLMSVGDRICGCFGVSTIAVKNLDEAKAKQVAINSDPTGGHHARRMSAEIQGNSIAALAAREAAERVAKKTEQAKTVSPQDFEPAPSSPALSVFAAVSAAVSSGPAAPSVIKPETAAS